MPSFIGLLCIGLLCTGSTAFRLNDSSDAYGPSAQTAGAIITGDDIPGDAGLHGRSIQDAYDFSSPEVRFELHNDLREISGITLFDEEHLAAIQDEKGRVYKIRIADGSLVEDDRFDDDGDYEDITRVGFSFFVLRSDGDLFETSGWPMKREDTIKHETILEARHDTEGLAYDSLNQRLLIACKEFAGKGIEQKKAIYAFDLWTREVDPEPAFLIDLKSIQERRPEHPLNKALRRFTASFTGMDGFKPSAIAIHPITGQLYVVSSVRKLLIALDPAGQINAVWSLPDRLFPQPEGMAFLKNGDLFISNEGRGARATLLRFDYRGR